LDDSVSKFGFVCLLWRFIYILFHKHILPAASIATAGLGLPETKAAFVIVLAGRADSVMTAIVAGKSKEGLPLMKGSLYGYAISAFSMNIQVLFKKSIRDYGLAWDNMIIYRDFGCYFIATLVLLVFAYLG
jgi:hypothetical protein